MQVHRGQRCSSGSAHGGSDGRAGKEWDTTGEHLGVTMGTVVVVTVWWWWWWWCGGSLLMMKKADLSTQRGAEDGLAVNVEMPIVRPSVRYCVREESP